MQDASPSQSCKRIAYLVNQYPKISHTFIRRELLALEKLGAGVVRISIRQVPEDIIDPVDQEELKKTEFIIQGSALSLMMRLATALLTTITIWPRILGVWFSLAKNAHGSFLKHSIYLAEACWLFRYCKQHDIQHLHTHFGTNPASVALFCRLMGGPEYSFTVHGPEEFDSPRELSLKIKIAHAKFVVAITSFCRSQLMRWAALEDWHKIQEVHCAVDNALLSMPSSVSQRQKYKIVNIGRLCEQKGQWILLKAVLQLKEKFPTITLSLVGDGDYRTTFERFVKENNLHDNVIFMGWMSGAQIAEQLDSAHAMVLPSFAEGLPVVIMEAFARRTPVVTTCIAGVPELVTHDNGWLVPAGDVDGLVAAIAEVFIQSESALRIKTEKAYEAISQRHNADIEAEKLMRAIHE